MSEQIDQCWIVVKYRNGSAEAIEQMNARIMAFHPALDSVRREHHEVLHDAYDVLQKDYSVSELFRRIISQEAA